MFRMEILSKLDIDLSVFTTNGSDSCFHVVPMGFVSFKSILFAVLQVVQFCADKIPEMAELYHFYKGKFKNIIGFQPTGWSMGKSISKVTRRKSGPFTIYGVPYSEHSNYQELRTFVAWIKPTTIIPTVDCSSPQKVEVRIESICFAFDLICLLQAILSHFKNLKDEGEDRSTLLPYLKKSISHTLTKFKQNVVDFCFSLNDKTEVILFYW